MGGEKGGIENAFSSATTIQYNLLLLPIGIFVTNLQFKISA